jgi:hypothetical protein
MRKLSFLALFLFFPAFCYGYNNFFYGTRSLGLSGYQATQVDIWQMSGNQAGIAEIKNPSVSIFYSQRFMLSDLSDKSIAFIYPSKILNLGLSYQNFGNGDYNETKIALGTARQFGQNLSAGLRMNYYSSFANRRHNQRKIYNLDAGIISMPIENLSIGCYLINFIPTQNKSYQEDLLLTTLGIGISYNFNDIVQLMSEYRANDGSQHELNGACVILLGNGFSLLTGFFVSNTNTKGYSFGLSFQKKKIELSFSFLQHNILGSTPSFQLNYYFNKK